MFDEGAAVQHTHTSQLRGIAAPLREPLPSSFERRPRAVPPKDRKAGSEPKLVCKARRDVFASLPACALGGHIVCGVVGRAAQVLVLVLVSVLPVGGACDLQSRIGGSVRKQAFATRVALARGDLSSA